MLKRSRKTVKAYLSLGSNLEPEENLRSAVVELRQRFGDTTVVSPAYRFPAHGFVGPDFLNAAAVVDSDISPFGLVRWLRNLEQKHGRMRQNVKFTSRSLDVDLVYFGDFVFDGPGSLIVPRPELRHAFVLKPLVKIAPFFVDPIRKSTLSELWAVHPDHDKVFPEVSIT